MAPRRGRAVHGAAAWLKRPPLAVRNVRHGGARSLVAVVGMALAVVMVLLQLGFLQAVRVTAAVNYDQLDFDVAVLSTQFEQFYGPAGFPRERLPQARAVPGVAAARPLWTRMNLWRCPPFPLFERAPGPTSKSGVAADYSPQAEQGALKRWWLGSKRPRPLQRRALLVIGFDPDDGPFRDPIRSQIAAAGSKLREAGRVLLNDRSNPDFGWDLWPRFSGWELGPAKVEVIGPFSLTRSFGADGAVLCTETNFLRTFGLQATEAPVNFGLVTVTAGADPRAVADRLRLALPSDVLVLTRDTLYRIESEYWVGQTASGKIISFGVFLTMVVAGVVVYQALANDIRDHLPEYGTLKAIGYGDVYLLRVIQTQAAIYAAACFPPAVALSAVVYRATEALANIPMALTGRNVLLALFVITACSQFAGVVSLRKLRQADPAELFR
jgi:putative ABC transport system permease protein